MSIKPVQSEPLAAPSLSSAEGERGHLSDLPVEDITGMVNALKAECLEKAETTGNSGKRIRFLLLAVGVSLFFAGVGFAFAAFAMWNFNLGLIGISLGAASILSMAAMALWAPPDYEYSARLVSEDLLGYAKENGIVLTPDNIGLNHALKRMGEKQKIENAQNEI